MVASEFTQHFYSEFDKKFKHVMKKFKHSFPKDFELVTSKVIINGIINRGINNIPKTDKISGLGESVKFPIFKTQMYIVEAKDYCGRVVYLVDETQKKIFFIDVYYKSDRENHDEELIKKAHEEYVDLFVVAK